MTDLDPRLHPYRDDLAAESLRGRIEAPAYVEGRPMQVAAGCIDLRRKPFADAPLDSQLLFGEEVASGVGRGMVIPWPPEEGAVPATIVPGSGG